ncbi:hypothetical protein [Microbispora sp. CSR-4]|uniref:hypothetical protein n=1 Tax=Microbispora sp. CSR-4 TaxID=2592813 RepID=UPI0011C971E4|nr:hypothetical protein [Microbispora sp. CSR-4]
MAQALAALHAEMEGKSAEELSEVFWFLSLIRGNVAQAMPGAAALVDHLRRVLALRWLETAGVEADATVSEALAAISVELAALRGADLG